MDNAKENSKYKYASRLSSSATTFLSLINGPLATHPEFVYKPDPRPKIKFKTEQEILYLGSKFVALELIALWMPNPGINKNNFISRYIHTSQDFSLFGMHLNEEIEEKYITHDSTDLDSIIKNYGLGNVFNISELMFLNILLYGRFTLSNLFAYYSKEDGNYYFSQSHEEVFFADYLYEDTTDYIQQFYGFTEVDSSSTWLDILSEHGSQLFIEMLVVALRVESTPDSLVELIIDSSLGKMYKFLDFKQHVQSIKKRAVTILYSLFESIDTHVIDNFKSTHGAKILLDYAEDIENFISAYLEYPHGNCLEEKLTKNGFILDDYLKYINLQTFYLGSFFNLPWPLPKIDEENSKCIPVSEFISMFNASLKVIDLKWEVITSFPESNIWQYINSIAKYLIDVSADNIIKNTSRLFLTPLFVVAAKNNFNHICKILLKENKYLASAVINRSNYTNWIFVGLVGKSIDECLEEFNNIEILALINQILQDRLGFSGNRPRSKAIIDEEANIEPKSHRRYGRRKSLSEDEIESIKPSIPRNKSNLSSLSFLGESAPAKMLSHNKSGKLDEQGDEPDYFHSNL